MKRRKSLTRRYEQRKYREGYDFVIGCDEVGRGCLAGPVVAASVILDFRLKISDLKDITDSKLLSAKQREVFDGIIRDHAIGWGIGVVDEKIIDKINIHNASLLAMRWAVEGLRLSFDFAQGDSNKTIVAIDGKFTIPEFNMKQEAIVDGDAKILSIAAASIIAKVHRDKLMTNMHERYPNYKFHEHKGYATLHHRNAIKKFGLTPIHRLSFCSAYI